MKSKYFKKMTLAVLLVLALFVTMSFATNNQDDMTYTKTHTVTGPSTLSGTTTISGTTTLSGATTISGAVTQSGLVTNTGGYIAPSETITATETLTTADCGKTIYLSHATTGIDLTLPAVTAGCEITFTVSLAFGDDHTVLVPAAANIIFGTLQVNAADVACTVEDTINFVDTAETVGDTVTLKSDGTSWLIEHSIADGAGAITCTT